MTYSHLQLLCYLGVPQGSVLGPILFTIYTHGLNVHFYADEYYMAFDTTDKQDAASVLTQLEDCISDIRMWMVENKLKLNDDKTEVILTPPPPPMVYHTSWLVEPLLHQLKWCAILGPCSISHSMAQFSLKRSKTPSFYFISFRSVTHYG